MELRESSQDLETLTSGSGRKTPARTHTNHRGDRRRSAAVDRVDSIVVD